MKKKIAFALLIGIVSTCIVSFTLISINIGFTQHFLKVWFKSWVVGYLVVTPVILLISAPIQRLIDKYVEH